MKIKKEEKQVKIKLSEALIYSVNALKNSGVNVFALKDIINTVNESVREGKTFDLDMNDPKLVKKLLQRGNSDGVLIINDCVENGRFTKPFNQYVFEILDGVYQIDEMTFSDAVSSALIASCGESFDPTKKQFFEFLVSHTQEDAQLIKKHEQAKRIAEVKKVCQTNDENKSNFEKWIIDNISSYNKARTEFRKSRGMQEENVDEFMKKIHEIRRRRKGNNTAD